MQDLFTKTVGFSLDPYDVYTLAQGVLVLFDIVLVMSRFLIVPLSFGTSF